MRKLIIVLISLVMILSVPFSTMAAPPDHSQSCEINLQNSGNDNLQVKGPVKPAPTTNTIKYLILGDSIAEGTDNKSIYDAIDRILNKYSTINLFNYNSLLNDLTDLQANPQNYLDQRPYRYTEQFASYLKSQPEGKGGVSVTDLSISGYTSANLLVQLQSKAADEAIISANIITISIGGNDMLVAGADSGFRRFDLYPDKWSAIESNLKSNLNNVLTYIRSINTNAKIIVMNFFNLYNPQEFDVDDTNTSLNSQLDLLLKGGIGENNLGDYFAALPNSYANLIIADTYAKFSSVNGGDTEISTEGTFAKRMTFGNPPYVMIGMDKFIGRFLPKTSEVRIDAPYTAWTAYNNEWIKLKECKYSITNYWSKYGATIPPRVTFDLYNNFYNPENYVFGYDEASSKIVQKVKSKCSWFMWSLIGPSLLKYIGNYATWRDVHCTALGHSLITKAHIDAYKGF